MNLSTIWLRAQAGQIQQFGEIAGLLPKSWEGALFLVVTAIVILKKKEIESWIGLNETAQKSSIDGKAKYEEILRASLAERDREIQRLNIALTQRAEAEKGQIEQERDRLRIELAEEQKKHLATFKGRLQAEFEVDNLRKDIERIREIRDQSVLTVAAAATVLQEAGLSEASEQITQDLTEISESLSNPTILLPGVIPSSEEDI